MQKIGKWILYLIGAIMTNIITNIVSDGLNLCELPAWSVFLYKNPIVHLVLLGAAFMMLCFWLRDIKRIKHIEDNQKATKNNQEVIEGYRIKWVRSAKIYEDIFGKNLFFEHSGHKYFPIATMSSFAYDKSYVFMDETGKLVEGTDVINAFMAKQREIIEKTDVSR